MDKTSNSRSNKIDEETMNGAIAIFVKTVGFSEVKTRLAKDIGKEKAEEFYLLSLNATKEIVQNLPPKLNITPYWAIAEKDALNEPRWRDFERIWTGQGELGNRLHNVYSQLQKMYDFVILIGSDTPQITADIIEKAVGLIDKNSFVIGSAKDGGFYLFAGCLPVKKETWLSTPYSVSNTKEVLVRKLACTVNELMPMSDVDDIDSLRTLTFSIIKTTPYQGKLKSWINYNFK